MKILVINCGSSSIKYQVFAGEDLDELVPLAVGAVSGLGQADALLQHEARGEEIRQELHRPDHRRGLAAILKALSRAEDNPAAFLADIRLVGHRAVHGGDQFTGAVMVDGEVMAKIEACIPLAPLHNTANLEGIRQARELLPQARHVAVFDTAFHQTLPPRAYMYAIPYHLYREHGVRKYGFHGTSCRYVSQRVATLLQRPLQQTKMVLCHLGNGVTVAAVKDGRSLDTSLGFTSLGGAMMGTRPGDLDPGVLLFLQRELGMSHEQVSEMLNQQSGILGVSGQSNNMRHVIKLAQQGNGRCRLALQMFTYRLKKYIGAYAAAMGGLDLVTFTGGIGENSPLVRELVLEDMDFLGIELDRERNVTAGQEDVVISSAESQVEIVVIHTNEELMIAREALALWQKDTTITTVASSR